MRLPRITLFLLLSLLTFAVRAAGPPAATPGVSWAPDGSPRSEAPLPLTLSAVRARLTHRQQAGAKPPPEIYLQALLALEKETPAGQAEALRLLPEAQRAGEADAAAVLGQIYEYGWGVAADSVRARQLYQQGLEAGSDLARVDLAVLLWADPDRSASRPRAVALLHEAAQHEEPSAQFFLGMLLEADPATRAECAEWQRRASEYGLPQATARLGWCYYLGFGVVKEETEAVRLWQLAAHSEFFDAPMFLAYACYQRKEYATAIKWARVADAHGHPAAAYLLGGFYLYGLGVAPDTATALQYMRRAADRGYAPAALQAGRLLITGDKAVFRDPVAGARYLQQAAATGSAEAERSLGFAYAHGIGVARDDQQAVALYRAAAAQNEYFAMSYLAHHLRLGRGVEKNIPEAMRLFGRAIAEGKSNEAMILLAEAFLEGGERLPVNRPAALKLLLEASKMGHSDLDYVLLAGDERDFYPYEPHWFTTYLESHPVPPRPVAKAPLTTR